jgi:hypothetical protein
MRYILLLFLLNMIILGSMTLAQDTSLISFELEDQFDRTYTEKDFENKIVIAICSDKDGSKYNGAWGEAIHDSLKDDEGFGQIKFLPVADVRGVPFFMKGFVKGKFPKKEEHWVLLDWKGQFAREYDLKEEVSNIIIFNDQGILVYKTYAKELDSHELNTILSKIRSLFSS